MRSSLKLAIAAALLIPMIGVGAVYATHLSISGTVQQGGSGLSNAKSTAERVADYKWDRADTSGNFQILTTTSNSYTVASTRDGSTRDTDTVNGGTTGLIQTVTARSPAFTDARFKVGYDTSTSVTLAEGRDWLTDGEPWYHEEHSIDWIETTASEAWTSAGATATCAGFRTHMNTDIGWTGGDYDGADILFGFSDGGFTDAVACTTTPGSGGTHPYIVANIAISPDIARTVMHEVTHNYGINHNTAACDTQIPGIMAIGPGPGTCTSGIYIKNWTPADDTTMEARRSWY